MPVAKKTVAKAAEQKPHLYRDAEFANARPEDRVCSRCGVVEWMDRAKGMCPGKPEDRDAFKAIPRTTRPRRAV